MSDVRRAVLADIPFVVEAMAAFHATASPDDLGFPFDRQYVAEILRGLIGSPDGFVVVLDADGKQVGALIAAAHPGVTSPALQATELAWWVQPEHRGTWASVRMVREYERWARERGCRSLHLSNMHVLKGSSVERFYDRMGYRAIQTDFVKMLSV